MNFAVISLYQQDKPKPNVHDRVRYDVQTSFAEKTIEKSRPPTESHSHITMAGKTFMLPIRAPTSQTPPSNSGIPLLATRDVLTSISRSTSLQSSKYHLSCRKILATIFTTPDINIRPIELLTEIQYCSSNFRNPSFKRSRRSSSNSPIPRRLQTV